LCIVSPLFISVSSVSLLLSWDYVFIVEYHVPLWLHS